MTDRELMQQALEALDVATTPLAKDRQEVLRAQAALRERLERPFVTDPCQCGKESFAWCMANSCHKAGLARQEQEQEQVAWIGAVDEYGPMLDWYRHWINFPVGTKLYTADQLREYAKQAVEAERANIHSLMLIQHEAAAGRHNYWQVAANLIAAERREHVTDDSPCWCNPETTYTDPDTGVSVIVHKEPQ